ncbi:hypothetical protein GCM10017714_08360 [Curtobacterium pusillum]|uniref:Camelysin metallo-endopeptidase n=1 Tax=Curtobacterium pusillum TaxID=69373 RepID=A0AAW3T5Y5_9MICO|nr:hypothetical protein [Curtobacterium pusillum]MBA8990343.1 hypothetical protein [Curtobacterium pusillum]NUU13071.1 hypothetical protein [Curtobacterium pusillum]GLK30099.1 hypothetical protein GCM10017610_03840 [Curtobacterium pusillum]
MKKPSARMRTLLGFGAAPLAIVIAGGLVWHSSYAAFTATTRNAGDSWSAGSVALTDDDKGAAAFSVTNLVPGDTGTKCIVVTSNANVPGEVRDYAANLSSTTGLSEHIQFKVEVGTGGSFNDCTGFTPDGSTATFAPLSTVASASHNYDTGSHPWDTDGTSESRSYRVTWQFNTDGMTQQQIDSLQGSTVSADVVWEFRSTSSSAS